MASVEDWPMYAWPLARLRRHFGGIPAERILSVPSPGTATERDLLFINDRGERICELVDGCLVEKAMGARESLLAAYLGHLIQQFLEHASLGFVLGADGALRFLPGLVRVPDLSFISWKRLGADELPDDPLPDLAPDLAVEVISKANTAREMDRKVNEYFRAGVRLVWLINPRKRIVEVFTSPEDKVVLGNGDQLDGGKVLPGFSVSLRELFSAHRRRRNK